MGTPSIRAFFCKTERFLSDESSCQNPQFCIFRYFILVTERMMG